MHIFSFQIYEKLYNKAYETRADAVKGNIKIYCPKTKSITQESWIDINSAVKIHPANFYFSFNRLEVFLQSLIDCLF
mgnify:CR=1 FL=1